MGVFGFGKWFWRPPMGFLRFRNRPDALVGRFLSSEAHHQLQYHRVLLRFLGDAAFGVEVLLVVHVDGRAETLPEAEGDSAR